MLWYDPDFDYTDQLAYKYMKFKGEYYDVGTICKIKGRLGPKLVTFKGWHFNNGKWSFELVNKDDYGLYDDYTNAGVNNYCLEIIEPIKPNLQEYYESNDNKFGLPRRDKPHSWTIKIAWIWYIFAMLISTIFKDRVMAWVFITAIFFLWKNGFLSKK